MLIIHQVRLVKATRIENKRVRFLGKSVLYGCVYGRCVGR
jgi:hypothetical protein